ncbi:MAG: hypothetical protein U5K36_03015 [Roseovarius sp.]|nr:hypothetical protein [Roseovarius sp.]
MPQPTADHVRPARHARLFELLRQQSQARAVAARLDVRRDANPATLAPLARRNAQSLLCGAAAPRAVVRAKAGRAIADDPARL